MITQGRQSRIRVPTKRVTGPLKSPTTKREKKPSAQRHTRIQSIPSSQPAALNNRTLKRNLNREHYHTETNNLV